MIEGPPLIMDEALLRRDDALPRYTAVAAYLHERDGDLATAARLNARRPR
ncbi:hypothetical protein [Micromonospora zingiberis]|nr:hypothetical protein [Micromonospora zingiberis]